jgi:hypothetical protein
MNQIFLLILTSALGLVFCSFGGGCGYNEERSYGFKVKDVTNKREPLPKSLSLPINIQKRESDLEERSPYIPSWAVIKMANDLGRNNDLDNLFCCHELRSTYGGDISGGSYDASKR